MLGIGASCYDPTPEEIAVSCRQIQAEWDENEFRRRAGYAANGSGWLPPTARLLLELGYVETPLTVAATYVGGDPKGLSS